MNSVNKTPWKRRTAAASFCALYAAAGFAGYRYLQDTRYRATGEPNPYKPLHAPAKTAEIEAMTDAGGIVEAHDTTPVYNDLAKEYDSKIGFEEITSYIWWMRRRVAKQIGGDALEVSCGTGRNLGWLRPKQISSVTLVDPSVPMLEVAKSKFDSKYSKRFADKPVQFVAGRAEDLELLTKNSGQRFDTVYETFGLCSHEDPARALAEMAAMAKPNGRIVLLEHGRGTYESMNQRMDKRAEHRAKEWGCRWNLDIRSIVENSPTVEVLERDNYHFGTIYFYVLRPKVPKVGEAPELGQKMTA